MRILGMQILGMRKRRRQALRGGGGGHHQDGPPGPLWMSTIVALAVDATGAVALPPCYCSGLGVKGR